MPITGIGLNHFTAFEKFNVKFSPGINVLIGTNGTGKTHLMKVAYAACEVSRTGEHFGDKLAETFLPSGRALGRMVKRQKGSSRAVAQVIHEEGRKDHHTLRLRKLRISFSNHITDPSSSKVDVAGARGWRGDPIESVFIPAKDILSNAPGFVALYDRREIGFEVTYRDIVHRASLPALKGPVPEKRRQLLNELGKVLEGKITVETNGEFFHDSKRGKIEFTLLSEGMCKLGLLWLLIQNGSLQAGSVLFWDEPEANLNPSMFGPVMEILLKLQRTGVQVFLATHDYVILEELNLLRKPKDQVRFLPLFRDQDTEEIVCSPTEDYLAIHPNAIADTFDDLYDREVRRSLGRDAQ